VRGSILDPYKPKIQTILGKYPDLSAVRILEEIAKPPEGYQGEITLVGTICDRCVPPTAGSTRKCITNPARPCKSIGLLRPGAHRPDPAAGLGVRRRALL